MIKTRSFRRFARPVFVAAVVGPTLLLGTQRAMAMGNDVPDAKSFDVTSDATCRDGRVNVRYTVHNTGTTVHSLAVYNESGGSAGVLPLSPGSAISIDLVPTRATSFTFVNTARPQKRVAIGPWDAASICSSQTAETTTFPATTSPAAPGATTMAPVDPISTPADESLPALVLGDIAVSTPAQAGSDTELAFTGSDNGMLGGVAVAMLVSGSGLMAVARRRPTY